MNDALRERLMKLHRLAEGGVGGEKSNAEAFLVKALADHNMTVDDLVRDETAEVRYFNFRTSTEQSLLVQIVAASTDWSGSTYTLSRFGKKVAKKIGFVLTVREMIEVELKFSAYRVGLKDALSLAFEAFVHTNDIYPHNSAREASECTKEERDRAERVGMMSRSMPRVNVRKQIGSAA